MADNVTVEDIQNYHSDDRQLFRRLIVDNGRNLVLCMNSIALWIVLENFGFPNLVQKLLKVHNLVANKIVDEAAFCIGWLQSVTPPIPVVNASDMPLTQELMGGKPISFSMVYANRKTVLTKVNKTVFDSLATGFGDIILEVSGMRFVELNVRPLAENRWSNGYNAYSYFNAQQTAPAIGGPSVYKDEHVPEIKRAIFFTFTRENPVQQMELESFLEGSFGDGCIKKVTMQQVPTTEEPLWASVVFHSEIPVHALMQGRETAPMHINGKKLWAGKEWLCEGEILHGNSDGDAF